MKGSRPVREKGIVLAIVLVLVFSLITAVYAFQRRAIIDVTVAQNRMAAAEADALARGGIRIAEALLWLVHRANTIPPTSPNTGPNNPPPVPAVPGADLWERLGDLPLELAGERSLLLEVEDEGALFNLNTMLPPATLNQPVSNPGQNQGQSTSGTTCPDVDECVIQLTAVLEYIVEGIPGPREQRTYDEQAIARNLIDWMDQDTIAIDGRDEDAYYRDQTPPYRASNRPFLSFDEIGLVEGIDGKLLEAMRSSLTVHPIGATNGINLNRAEPWVLALVYGGVPGQQELIGEKVVRDILALRSKGKIICTDPSADPDRCVDLADVGNGALAQGTIVPPIDLPAKPSVFRVTVEARVDNLVRRQEAVIDTRPEDGPLLLSWRRLRGTD